MASAIVCLKRLSKKGTKLKKITTYYGTNIYQLDDGVIMNSSTQQIVVYDSANSILQMFFRNGRAIGTANNETGFDFNNPEFLSIPIRF